MHNVLFFACLEKLILTKLWCVATHYVAILSVNCDWCELWYSLLLLARLNHRWTIYKASLIMWKECVGRTCGSYLISPRWYTPFHSLLVLDCAELINHRLVVTLCGTLLEQDNSCGILSSIAVQEPKLWLVLPTHFNHIKGSVVVSCQLYYFIRVAAVASPGSFEDHNNWSVAVC